MAINNTIIEENEPVVATQETQDSITKTGTIMTTNNTPVEENEPVDELNELLNMIKPHPGNRDIIRIEAAFKNEGGSFKKFEAWLEKIMQARGQKRAARLWKKDDQKLKKCNISTLVHYTQVFGE